MFVQATKSTRADGKIYVSYLVRESFRTPQGPRSRTVCNITGLPPQVPMYFTHSFAFYPSGNEDVMAQVDHGGRFPAAVARGNVAGVQFHPEKSQAAGLRLLANFLEWRP